jgi:hypothetical protein
MAAMTSTARTGCLPTAVSSDNITASLPSRMAFATSATSARVGCGEDTIEKSIWVAVMTGFARRFASAMSCFCTMGTRANGVSMLKSPRAIMIPSAALRISVEVIHRRLGLDLRAQGRVAAEALDVSPGGSHVLGRAANDSPR